MGKLPRVRMGIFSNVDMILSKMFSKPVRGERGDLLKDVSKWAYAFGEDNGLRVEVSQRDEPLTRTTIVMRDATTYLITIHHPLVPPHQIPSESITGADYAVEYPVNGSLDKFILVQLKRKEYPVTPKQYFGMGSTYMFAQYLIDPLKPWGERFRSGGEYVTRSRRPSHNEFMFLKLIKDPSIPYDEDLYVALSSVLRTHKTKRTCTTSRLALIAPKKGDINQDETATLMEFSKPRQHMTEYFLGFSEFLNAANSCKIGLKHPSTPNIIEKKRNVMFHLSIMLDRPNIFVVETTDDVFRQLQFP